MTILLFGVSNVGKSITGELLAKQLGYHFYDLDEEVKKRQHTTIEKFVTTELLEDRDYIRGCIIGDIFDEDPENKIIAVTPISFYDNFEEYLEYPEVLAIELRDTPENIFKRLVFSDENDVVYFDDDYKNANAEHYLTEIARDLEWYGQCNERVTNKFDMNGDTPEEVVSRLINEYDLKKK